MPEAYLVNKNIKKKAWLVGCVLSAGALSALTGVVLSGYDATLLAMNALVFILFCLCIAPMLLFRIKNGVVDIFHTAVFIPLIYFIYFGLGPYFYLLRKELSIAANVVPQDLINPVLLLAIAGLVFFYSGYIAGHKVFGGHIRQSPSLFEEWIRKRLIVAMLFTMFFFVLVNLLFWESAGGIPILISGYYKEAKTELMAGKGYYEFLALSIVPVSLLLLNIYWSLKNKSLLLKVTTFLLFVITLSIPVVNLFRGLFLTFIVLAIVSYHYMNKRLGLKKLFVLFLLVVLLATGAGYLRSQQWSEEEWAVFNVLLLEAASEFDNYAKTVEVVPDELDLQMGKTVLPLITTPIPRALFPRKDEFKPAQVVIKEFLGHDFIRIGERITLVAELFMNFHVFGVAFGMMLFGFIAAIAHGYLYPLDNDPLRVTLYVLTLITGLAYQIPGDIASVTVGYIQFMLPIVIWVIIFALGRFVHESPKF